MKSTNLSQGQVVPKKQYIKPKLQKLGNVKKLTLKSGSNTDMLGGRDV